MHGEQSVADKKDANYWIKIILLSLIENYEEKGIYNIDELGLFFKALPNGMLESKGKNV